MTKKSTMTESQYFGVPQIWRYSRNPILVKSDFNVYIDRADLD